MAKYLRIPAELQTTNSNGDFLLDADVVVNIVPTSDTVLTIRTNRVGSTDATITLTLSTADTTRITHEILGNAICAAVRGEKGASPCDLQPLPGSRTVAIAFAA
jgi:hypothetical protein